MIPFSTYLVLGANYLWPPYKFIHYLGQVERHYTNTFNISVSEEWFQLRRKVRILMNQLTGTYYTLIIFVLSFFNYVVQTMLLQKCSWTMNSGRICSWREKDVQMCICKTCGMHIFYSYMGRVSLHLAEKITLTSKITYRIGENFIKRGSLFCIQRMRHTKRSRF